MVLGGIIVTIISFTIAFVPTIAIAIFMSMDGTLLSYMAAFTILIASLKELCFF